MVNLAIEHCLGNRSKPPHKLHIFKPGQLRVKRGFFRDVAEMLSPSNQILSDVPSPVENMAAQGFEQAGQHLHRGALAGTIRSELPIDFTWVDAETRIINGGNADIPFGQPFDFEHLEAPHTSLVPQRYHGIDLRHPAHAKRPSFIVPLGCISTE